METAQKIAVAGATRRVGRHVVDVATERGYEVVAMSRSQGVDVITGQGLADALAGVDCVIDVATGPSPEQEAAIRFFTAAAGTCTRRGRGPACSGWWPCRSSAPTGSWGATGRQRSPTKRSCWPDRFRRGSCGRPSSTSSWSSS